MFVYVTLIQERSDSGWDHVSVGASFLDPDEAEDYVRLQSALMGPRDDVMLSVVESEVVDDD